MTHQEDRIYIIRTDDGEYGTARYIGADFSVITFKDSMPEPILNEDFYVISEIILFDEEYDD